MSIKSYLKETRGEMKQVNWPTRTQAIRYTIAVIVISVVLAYFLGLFDRLFQLGLGALLGF
jgi:preprotein translocase subunit SecE